MRWVLFVVAWLAAVVLLLGARSWSTLIARRAAPSAAPASAVTRALSNAQRGHARGFPLWTVTRAYSAHHTMVVYVETERVEQSRHIAAQLVDPLKGRYDEVLVYVRKRGTSGNLAMRRVQWTPRDGFAEINFAER